MRDDYRQSILNRWKTIEGHARAVRRMIEEDQYCVDILKQILAVQGAIDKVNALLLENHLKTCVTTAIRSDVQAERERVIGEVLALFQGGSHVAWNRHFPMSGDRDVEGEPAIAADGGEHRCD